MPSPIAECSLGLLAPALVLALAACGGDAESDAGTETSTESGTSADAATDASDTQDASESASGSTALGTDSGTGADTGDSGSSTGSPGTFVDYETLSSSYIDAPPQGGARPQLSRDVAFDSQGNLVVVGGTSAPNFPTTAGAYDTAYGGPGPVDVGQFGDMDAFVAKFDPDGNLLWSTFLGGASYDRAYGVEIGPNDDVFVAGRAGISFPTTAGTMQETFAGDDEVNGAYGSQDGFVARLSADGSDLLWASYIGGVGRGFVRDLDINAEGDVYLALSDVGGPMAVTPQSPGPDPAPLGARDGYYARISSDGSTMLFGTYLGGSTGGAEDFTNPSIRVLDSGEVYVVGFSGSTNVACVAAGAYQPANAGGLDLVLAKFDSADGLEFCSYYGGSGDEAMETHTLAVDDEGNAYIAGGTSSADLPTTAGAALPDRTHGWDGFVAKISPDGGALLAATYVGSAGLVGTINAMNIEGLAVTPSGDIVGGGSTRPQDTSTRHGVIVRISSDLSELRYLETYGGSRLDELRSVAVAPNGDVLFGGHTTSDDLTTANAFDTDYSVNPELSATYLLLRPMFE